MTELGSILEKHDIIQLLQSQQITPTKQRIDIAQLLFERPQHLCAEQVINQLVERGGRKVSKATVYNTLHLFSQQGLVRELCIEPGRAYYDTTTRKHHHIYNIDTGELWDVEASSLPEGFATRLPEGTIAVGVDVVYRVRCEQRLEG